MHIMFCTFPEGQVVKMKWYMDKEYMKDHLSTYIKFQLRQGYVLEDVKDALLRYGYDKSLVDEIAHMIDEKNYRPRKINPAKRELDEELYVYLQNLLVDYIKKEMDQGYTIDVIRRALIKYGHHPNMVKKAVTAVKHGRVTDLRKTLHLPPAFLLFVSLLGIVAFMMFMVLATEVSIYTVVLAFAPCLIVTLLSYAYVARETNRSHLQFVPIVALAGVVVVYIMLVQLSPAMAKISEPGVILVLNVVLAFLSTGCIALLSRVQRKPVVVEEITESEEAEAAQPLEKAVEHAHARTKAVHKDRREKKLALKSV